MEDLRSRDYDFNDIDLDPRFKICNKEMILTFIIWALYTIVTLCLAYGLGRGPVEEYRYICGMPTWWFATIISTAVFTLIVIYVTLLVFKDMDLEDTL